jgi:hypothetical protein
MPKFYGQNKKRIDPRYFLNENTTGYTREEVESIIDNKIGIDAWHSARHSDDIAQLLVANFEKANWGVNRKENLEKVWEFVEFGVIDANDVTADSIADAITNPGQNEKSADEFMISQLKKQLQTIKDKTYPGDFDNSQKQADLDRVWEKLRSRGVPHPYDPQEGDIDSFGNPIKY